LVQESSIIDPNALLRNEGQSGGGFFGRTCHGRARGPSVEGAVSLCGDITEMGEAVLLETVGLDQRQQEKVIERFNHDRNEWYQEFIGRCTDFEAEIDKETGAKHFTYGELEENDEDLKKLRGWLDKICKLDFYGAPLAREATAHLERCEILLDTYARKVFAAQEENRTSQSETESE
jgi:hypothetical protein